MILTYTGDPLMCALAHLGENSEIKDQLLHRYIRDSQKDADYGEYNIEEQIQLITASSYRKEQKKQLALQNLYQFHRNRGDHERVYNIIKNYFKFIVYPCNSTGWQHGCPIDKLSDETLNLKEESLLCQEKHAKKFMKHYLPAQVNGPDFAKMDQLFQTLLSASTDSMVCGRLLYELQNVPDEPEESDQ